MIRLFAIVLSLALHASLGLFLLPQKSDDADLRMAGSGEDLFVVEQGVAIDSVTKLGDEAEETIETAAVAPMELSAKPPEPQVVKPLDELQDAITSTDGKEDNIVKTEDPPPERKPEEITEIKPEEPPPPELKKVEPEQLAVQEQVAVAEQSSQQSSGRAQTGGESTEGKAYQRQLWTSIKKAAVTRATSAKGAVHLRFSVGAKGELLSREIVTSSGHPSLDKTALSILERAAPFPPLPAAIAAAGTYSLTVTLAFK